MQIRIVPFHKISNINTNTNSNTNPNTTTNSNTNLNTTHDTNLNTNTNSNTKTKTNHNPGDYEERDEERKSEEEPSDEDYLHALRVCYVTYHEMRHLYQKCAVEVFRVNKLMGGKVLEPLESDRKCEIWEREMTRAGENKEKNKEEENEPENKPTPTKENKQENQPTEENKPTPTKENKPAPTKENKHRAEQTKDIEEDAEAFAFYLLHRFPLDEPPGYTNRRIGVLKRKYDGVKIR